MTGSTIKGVWRHIFHRRVYLVRMSRSVDSQFNDKALGWRGVSNNVKAVKPQVFKAVGKLMSEVVPGRLKI